MKQYKHNTNTLKKSEKRQKRGLPIKEEDVKAEDLEQGRYVTNSVCLVASKNTYNVYK
jgi:hypothetical protein